MPRAVVTGGAGFLASHLCDRLLAEDWEVICFDSLLTGAVSNLAGALSFPAFQFEEQDVTEELTVHGTVDAVLHFASPASPIDYLTYPIKTLKVGAIGTLRAVGLAKAKSAAFVLASTSEVYGDPKVHPQPESYWGNVNPIGPRAVYDEAKRYAEALSMAYHYTHGVPVKILRIFNTYGPRMRRRDGRAVPTFIDQALRGAPVTVHGDGTQTRSLCYIDDLIEGIMRFLRSDAVGVPVNLGNPHDVTVLDLARTIVALAESSSEIVFTERPIDDPEVRCPDISRASSLLGWSPEISLDVGLRRTIEWAKESWADEPIVG